MADPKQEAEKEAKKIFSRLKGVGIDLNVLVSLLNPIISDTAEAAAEVAKRYVGEYPWMQSKAVESAIGGVAAAIEGQAQKHPEPVKVALQKIADWFETFALALSQETKKKTKKPTGSPQRDDLVAKAQAERIKEFARRLAEAQTSEVDPLIERVKKEARALAEAEKLMNEGPPEPPEPPKPPKEKPWMKKAGQGLQAVNDAKVLEPVQSGIERLNDWLRRKI